jgi:hypothetical protein
MNKFESFLSAVGRDFKKGLDVILPIASAAAAGLTVVNPALGGILTTSIGVVIATEQKFAAMGQQNGTGSQKLAESVSLLYPAFEQIFSQYGVSLDKSHVETYVNAIVAALNAFPAIPAATAGVAAAAKA